MDIGEDPMDRAIQEFLAYRTERQIHQGNLGRFANVLVNNWRNALSPIVNDYNQKLRSLGLQLHLSSGFGANGAEGSALSILATGTRNFETHELGRLVFTLQDTGDVQFAISAPANISITGDLTGSETGWPNGGPLPEQRVRQLLARLAENSLRV